MTKLPKVSALTAEDAGWGFYLCTYKEFRTGRSGSEFVFLSLQDSTGQIVAKLMSDVDRLKNEFEAGEQYHRFLITPQTLMKAEKTAGGAGQLVLGFYHSHPDHPARPSEYDREHAWPFYSYVIVSIMQRKPESLTSWVLDDATKRFPPPGTVKK